MGFFDMFFKSLSAAFSSLSKSHIYSFLYEVCENVIMKVRDNENESIESVLIMT